MYSTNIEWEGYAAAERAGVTDSTWHALRHNIGFQSGDERRIRFLIAKMLRHSSTALVKRYAHLRPGYLKTAYEGISAYGKAAPQDAQTISSPTGTETGKEDLDQVRVNA